jgi:hypothetical protein
MHIALTLRFYEKLWENMDIYVTFSSIAFTKVKDCATEKSLNNSKIYRFISALFCIIVENSLCISTMYYFFSL